MIKGLSKERFSTPIAITDVEKIVQNYIKYVKQMKFIPFFFAAVAIFTEISTTSSGIAV